MAYTLPNIGVIHADKWGKNRVVHRRARLEGEETTLA